MELEHVLVYGLVNVGGEIFIPNQAEIKVIFHGGMSWLFCSLKVEFIWSQFRKGVSQKISRFGTVSSFQYLLGLDAQQQSRRTWGCGLQETTLGTQGNPLCSNCCILVCSFPSQNEPQGSQLWSQKLIFCPFPLAIKSHF